MNKSKKRNIIIGGLCAVVLLMVVGYAAFQTVLNVSGTSNITSNWNIKITGVTTQNIKGAASNKEVPTFTDTTATFKTDLKSPGDSLEYEVTVTNAGNLNAKVNEVTLSDTNNPAIKFTSSGITKGDVINAGSTGTLIVKVEFLSTVTTQPTDTISDLTVTLDYSQPTSGGSTGGQTLTTEDLKALAVTNGDGLYEDTYETGRYVYKGANPNNYITFNSENANWRIMAVETDGTLKIRRAESIGKMAFDSAGLRDISSNGAGGTYCAQGYEAYGCNAWAKSDNFINGIYNGTVLKDAELNIYLNNDYYNLLSKDSKNQIQSHKFGIGAVIERNSDLSMQIANENEIIWIGNIALMSVSDYLIANLNIEQCGNFSLNNINSAVCKTTNYLFSEDYPLILSPYADAARAVFYIKPTGNLEYDFAASSYNVIFPTLYLKSHIILSGSGTQADPYIIK